MRVFQAFFTYRIYIVSHRQLLLCIPLWFLELVDMALTFTTAYMAYESRNILVFQERWGPLVYSTLIIGVVVRHLDPDRRTLSNRLCAG
jgi:hypothetical protein